jgi:hypothetical protein
VHANLPAPSQVYPAGCPVASFEWLAARLSPSLAVLGFFTLKSIALMIMPCQTWRSENANDTLELDQMQNAYKAAVEEWITAINQEEALATVDHSIAEVDKWEQAHFSEEKIRSKVKAAKKRYEDGLRKKFYGF